MLSYELAKQLKDAGFPQVLKNYPIWENIYYKNGELAQGAFKESILEEGMIKCPTLSELIEACGLGFQLLYKTTDTLDNTHEWRAGNAIESNLGVGKTPEESVAKLWQELNK